MTSKLKMIDTLGALKAEIKKLEAKAAKIEANLKYTRGVGEYEGDLYQASVYEGTQCSLNNEKIKKLLGAKYGKYQTRSNFTAVRCTPKKQIKSRK